MGRGGGAFGLFLPPDRTKNGRSEYTTMVG